MDASNQITAAVFSAFLKCSTKAHVLAIGEPAPDSFFADIEARISTMYRTAATQRLHIGADVIRPLAFSQLQRGIDNVAVTHHIDCDTVVYDLALPPQRSEDCQSQQIPPWGTLVPVLFLPSDKPDISDNLRLCFGALALSQCTGVLADTGTLIYGDDIRHKTVKIGEHVARARQVIDLIGANRDSLKSPQLVLNSHCPVCDFQSKCRALAIERDDLSLLTAMTGKERMKCSAKGISTITQLSYGYRPRRRKRTRPDAERSAKVARRAAPVVKNDHKLRALAVKKGQIHVVGSPSARFDGVPTFLDVEGMPDRGFYYLVGLRFECGGEQVERSFWADGLEGERIMWESCLRELKAIGNTQIVSYGAYETRFLRQMKARHIEKGAPDAEFVDRLIETSVNLVGCIYGRIYFPTYSNSLKEIGRYLGFEWGWPRASGAATLLLRRAWELGADDELKRELIAYNMDDCRAAATVADALMRICAGSASGLKSIEVGSLEVGFQRTFGKFDSAMPEFGKINSAAYWDYQRSKVYARTDKTVRQTVRKALEKTTNTRVNKDIIEDIPNACRKCNASDLKMISEDSYLLYDLKFLRNGIRRWVLRCHYGRYRCSKCRAEMSTYSGKAHYGPSLRAFVIYLMIELRLSNQKAAEHASSLFDLPLDAHKVHHIKSFVAEKYMPAYRGILRQIASGPLIHADETKGAVRGGGHYIWVFANMTTVAYVYAESRESVTLDEMLNGFSGVLVSDFYAAYDSVPCAQQKCLIHLMRDINEDLHRNPFDDELKEIAGRFGVLLRAIVETIDTYGLKARHLGKHRQPAARFIEGVVATKYATEAASALKKRIEKNRDKLFTFLDYDGVPWNNNNAEHAVKAFVRIRNTISNGTPNGHREYATLLSIQQTLRYRGMGFLDFMRSGKMEIDG